MTQVINVNVAEQRVTSHPNKIFCGAIGACVAVCLADKQIGLIGVSRVMLPEKTAAFTPETPARYAHTAVERLLSDMLAEGAERSRIVAKLVGGATLYPDDEVNLNASIGQRNLQAVCAELSKLGVPMISCDIGGDYGRSISISADTFAITVRTLARGETVI